ncbi:unnamed protein product [Boreogadus saida]
MPSNMGAQGGKAFGALKAQQREKLDEINKEYMGDQKFRDEEDLPEKLEGFKKLLLGDAADPGRETTNCQGQSYALVSTEEHALTEQAENKALVALMTVVTLCAAEKPSAPHRTILFNDGKMKRMMKI